MEHIKMRLFCVFPIS